jgi:photosynthetic reaction center cytochrome c subunit
MSKQTRSSAIVVSSLTALIVLVTMAGRPSPSRAQTASGSADVKTTEQQFKNIQVLKGLPADQLIPSMQFISGSLGVECEFCHVEGAFEKDDKKPKLAARKMMQMMFAINKDNFEGHREVTCNSCHRGSPHPAGIPAIASTEPAAALEHGAAHEHEDHTADASQSADPILEKYLAAVGGAEAIRKVLTRVEKGTAAMGDRRLPIEVFAQAPDKRVSFMHLPNGDSITAFDGTKGWLGNPGRPPRPMGTLEAEAARLDADLYFPARLKEIFHEFKVASPEKIGDQEVTVVRALREGKPPVNLYFEKQSGLLVRMVRYADTPLGLLPTELDYADYRDSGGVKIPFRWTIARPSGSFTIQVDHVEQNVAVDARKFVQPEAPPGENKPSSH